MKLYSSAFSPYAARCRIQIRHKDLPVEIVPPPDGMGSAQVKARNPLGKIPVLDLGDDALFESAAIMEYLEALHPHTPMRPASPLDAAKQQALIRFADLYLAAAMFPLFRALRGAVGPEGVAEAINGVKTQLQALDALLPLRPQRPGLLDLADAALLPIIWYARILMRHFDHGADCLAPTPQVAQWWSETSQVPAAATVLGEMEAGLRAALPMLFTD